MKKIAAIMLLVLVGCGTPTVIRKSVEVHKDADGKIREIVEIESVEQHLDAMMIKLERITVEKAKPLGGGE